MHCKMLQSAGTPVLRKLLRREQRPGGSRFDSGGGAAKRMQHPFEGCEQPGVSPAYTFLGKRIVQHIDERGRTGAAGHLGLVRQRGDKERTIAADREERSRASGINERAAGDLDLAYKLPRARIHDSERLRRGIVVDEQETIIVGQGLGAGHGHDRCSLRRNLDLCHRHEARGIVDRHHIGACPAGTAREIALRRVDQPPSFRGNDPRERIPGAQHAEHLSAVTVYQKRPAVREREEGDVIDPHPVGRGRGKRLDGAGRIGWELCPGRTSAYRRRESESRAGPRATARLDPIAAADRAVLRSAHGSRHR